jgi:hypothetical protein
MKKIVLLRNGFVVAARYAGGSGKKIGQEVAVPIHLQDGEELTISTKQLGRRLFTAMWTSQEGAGRPLSKGTGATLTDPSDPLVFPRISTVSRGRTRTPAPVATTSR